MTHEPLFNCLKSLFTKTFYIKIIGIFLFSFFVLSSCGGDDDKPIVEKPKKSAEEIKKEKDSTFVAAITVDEKDSIEAIRLSYPLNRKLPFEEDKEAGKRHKTVYNGRRINIALTGVDGRLGTATKHADANHVISILLDSAQIEITSIPRDTPANAGYPEGHNNNKLTIVRSARGRQAYLRELARIARVDKIHFYIEVGFSQVIGILDFLGFDDPASTLQVLRSRKALGGDDYQRVYNQGQFIRQMILKHFDKFTGLTGEVIVRGGLMFVETNYNVEMAQKNIEFLEKMKFPKDPSCVTVRVRPPHSLRYKNYDFTDNAIVDGLQLRIEDKNKKHKNWNTKNPVKVQKKLEKVIASAIKDSSKSPSRVIGKLKNYFNQRAWHQVKNDSAKPAIRDQICRLMIDAYTKKEKFEEANKIKVILESEKKLFEIDINK